MGPIAVQHIGTMIITLKTPQRAVINFQDLATVYIEGTLALANQSVSAETEANFHAGMPYQIDCPYVETIQLPVRLLETQRSQCSRRPAEAYCLGGKTLI